MLQAADPANGAPAGRRVTVIVVNDFGAITGGSDRVALGEALELARRGHRVILVAGNGDPEPDLQAAGVAVHITGQHPTLADPNRLRAATQGIWNRAAAAVLRRVLADAEPKETVVHVHGFAKVLSPSVVRVAARSGLPVVATLHDYFAACPNGGFFNYQTESVCPLTPLSLACVTTNCDARAYSHKLWRVGRSAVQRSFGAMPSGVGHFIAPSDATATILRPYLPATSELYVLPNAIEVSRDSRANVAANSLFLFTGRLTRDKGAVTFARAARQAGVRAVFAGAGEEAEVIRRVNPDAELTGWLEPADVHSRIRAARAAVSPSLWYETQGLFPLEAAANGVATVVSDVSVATESVADGVTGLWFRSGDVDDLADKLATLQAQPQLADRLGAAAYERFWSRRRDMTKHVQRLERIYEAALNR